MRPRTDRPTPAWAHGLAVLVLAVAVFLVYRNSLPVPFIFDDVTGIERNGSIRHLWPPTALLHPPFDTSVTGRPLLNLSLALNYAISGAGVRGYHVGNLVIHLLAGLALFGVVRRTLAGAPTRYEPGDCTLLAFAVALLWLVHPLQTESVTYLMQRAEALMGLCYLLTLYCFVRATAGEAEGRPARPAWLGLSLLCCLLGMATKEVMVSAPVVVLLYDRTFVAGNFREAWRRRRGFYLGLAATWLLVAWLVLGTKSRGGTAGFGVGVGWGEYVLTQFPAVARYLHLVFWPQGQIFDYGAEWVRRVWTIWPEVLLVGALVGATLWALARRPACGFLGFCFLAILAPTSLIPGNRQTIAEHRMYLALAPLLILVVVGCHRAAVRLERDRAARNRSILVLTLILAATLGVATARRNAVYLTDFRLWDDTVAARPGNFFARENLGNVLLDHGMLKEALAQYDTALRMWPDFPEGHNNRGNALARANRLDEAEAEYRAAIRLRAKYYPEAHNNLGVALALEGDPTGALREFQEIRRAQPDYLDAYVNEGNSLVKLGRNSEALAAYAEALRRGLDLPPVHNGLGRALAELGRTEEARRQFELVLRSQPDNRTARQNLDRLKAPGL